MFEYNAVVRRVIDGDTLEVDIDLGFKTILQKEKLRLLDIDTPELRSQWIEEQEHARQAKDFVYRLLNIGDEIIVQTEKDKKGKYGRYLARVKFRLTKTPEKWADLSTVLNENGFAKKDKYKI